MAWKTFGLRNCPKLDAAKAEAFFERGLTLRWIKMPNLGSCVQQ